MQYGKNAAELQHAAFAMFCFWTGEKELGAAEGVVQTEAGLYDGREITRFWYDDEKFSTQQLIDHARAVQCAQRVYLSNDSKELRAGQLSRHEFKESEYRKAPKSDQKKQIPGTHFAKLELSDYQKTKVNAFARNNPKKALTYLSPKQLMKLEN